VNACPAILSGDAGLAAGMGALDCQINAAVTLGYGRLFAPGGVFGVTLTSLLTLYVAFIAFGLITGRTRLTLPSMTPKVLTLGLILTFATAWPAYQAVVYGLLTKGPDQIASAFLGRQGGASRMFADRLDGLFEQMTDVAGAVSSQGQANAPNVQTAIKLTWASALTLLISTAGLLIVSRIVLAVLLALGPVFIVLALFQRTRGLFEGWLKTATALAFTPMLLVLGGSGVLAALSPIITRIADDPAAAVHDMRPILTLFLGAVIYAMLLVALAWTAVSLTRGWSLKLGEDAPAAPDVSAHASAQSERVASPHAIAASSATDSRISNVTASVLRETSAVADRRVEIVSGRSDVAAPPASAAARPRVEGLGQTFRAPRQTRALTGTIGS
jgi:type IV secretion system protein VirB6